MALTSLVESERAFSRAAAELGARDAFIAYMADDAVIFRPQAVNAQEFLREQPATPGVLSWEPAFADVGDAGDLGFTTGPWKYRSDPNGEYVAFGQYFSFWKKQSDGTWKVVIDHGTTQPEGDASQAVRNPVRATAHETKEDPADIAEFRESLLESDRAFARDLSAAVTSEMLATYAEPSIRLLRNGGPPLHGIESMSKLASETAGPPTWVVLGGDVSRSGDLGYTYGEYAFTTPDSPAADESGNYVRAWRRSPDGAWRIVVNLVVPVPPVPGG
jgi:ketosteroid isomerase-like protein